MRCFSVQRLAAFGLPLSQLSIRGLLVAERLRGGFSRTETGFAGMNRGK